MKHDEVKRNTYYKLSNHSAEYTLLRESGYQKVYHGARLGAFLSKTSACVGFLRHCTSFCASPPSWTRNLIVPVGFRKQPSGVCGGERVGSIGGQE